MVVWYAQRTLRLYAGLVVFGTRSVPYGCIRGWRCLVLAAYPTVVCGVCAYRLTVGYAVRTF